MNVIVERFLNEEMYPFTLGREGIPHARTLFWGGTVRTVTDVYVSDSEKEGYRD